MHIDSVILDGFKSYSTRTVIGPLDPHFNAVTGLNGTGKSNVLDSLCFAFGISDLTRVRANKLDELIYKQGQAGITKASVTVIFNNTHPASPLPDPYRKMPEVTVTRQIAIGGRNRYFLNSHPATPKAIADFFQAARMNVNNARFLIMQGRVTKVVNMKPKELLSLIEEASGTRIYEAKRAAAVKLMTRKEQKLAEIRKILAEEIEPSMRKLENDRDDFIRWSNAKEECDRLERFDVAHRYWQAKEKLSNTTDRENTAVSEKTAIQQDLSTIDEELERLKQQFNEKRATIDKANKPLAVLQNLKDGIKKEISKLESNKNIMERDMEELLTSTRAISAEIEAITKKLVDEQSASATDSDNLEKLSNELEKNKELLAELEASIGAGLTSCKDGRGTRQAHLKELKTKLSKIEAEESSTVKIISHLESEIKKQEKDACKISSELTAFRKSMDELENKKARLQSKLDEATAQLDSSGGMEAMERLQSALRDVSVTHEACKETAFALNAELNRHRIKCKVPHQLGTMDPNDINSPCYGQAFDILSLNEDMPESFSLPIHVLTGFKLNYLVVRDKECGKLIFETNNFAKSAKKVTVLPLKDVVLGRVVTESDVRDCRKLVGVDERDASKVASYLDVLKFDPKFMRLAQYVMGNALFCSSSEYARAISYQADKSRAFPTATFQGDKFDVGGSMSGGSNKGVYMILQTASKLKVANKQVEDALREIDRLKREISQFTLLVENHRELKKQLDLCNNDLNSAVSRLKSSSASATLQKLEGDKILLNEKKTLLIDVQSSRKELEKKVKDLAEEILDWEKNKNKNEKAVKEKIKTLKNAIRKDTLQLDTMQESISSIKLEQDNLKHQISALQEELAQKTASISSLKEQITDVDESIKNKNVELNEANNKINEITQLSYSSQNEIQEIQSKLDGINQNKNQMNVRLKKLEYAIQEMEKEGHDAQVTVDKLVRENPWIPSEEDNFNKKGTTFDFTNVRLETVSKRLNELIQLKHDLSRKVNRKAQQLYEKVEHDYHDLVLKMGKVEEDKNKIQDVIADLDVKKHESINMIFSRITKYFSDIFHILLSNAQAKLVPVNGDITNGIEMKVGFNDKWKNSLSELSGGQRSLLALSLILAMLKVRPAPIYILDEVDAALDLSHTQNIGKMIKTQFPNSQFIIVSLKDGMFSNANVLFKTRFVDGASTITRHALADNNKKQKDDEV